MKIKKFLKKIFKIFGIIILVLTLTLVGNLLLLQIPFVQKHVAKISINYLSKQINADISLGSFKYSDLNTIILEDIKFNDTHNNSMFTIGYIKVIIKRISINQKVFHFKEVIIRDCNFNHIKYENSLKSNLLMVFPAKDKNKIKDKNKKPLTILSDYFRMYNWTYKFKDYNHKEENIHIDFKDLYVTDAYAEFIDLTVINDSISTKILNLALKEGKGFDLQSFNSDVIVSSTTIHASNTAIITDNSNFTIDLIFDYPNWKGFRNFTDSVYILSKIRNHSKINIIDIGQFTSVLAGADNLIEFAADVDGPVNHMDVTDIDLSIYDVTYYAGDVFLRDVDKGNIYLGLDIKNFITDATDISLLNVPAFEKNVNAPEHIELPEPFDKLGIISLSGKFAGEMDNFSTNLTAQTEAGTISTDIIYNKISETENDFNIQLTGNKLNIGEILSVAPKIKTVDLTLQADGIAEKFIPKTFSLDANISKISLQNLLISDVQLQSTKDDEELFAHLSVFNEELFLDASLIGILSVEPAIYNSSLAINHINLSKFGIGDLDKDFIVGGFINGNISGTTIDDVRAQINGTNLFITYEKETFNLGDISFSQISNKDWDKIINFKSGFLDFIIEGNFLYDDIIVLYANVINKLLPNLTKELEETSLIDDVRLQAFIDLKNPDLITFGIPDFDISKNTSLFINVDDTSRLSIDIYSENIRYLTYNLNEINFYSDIIDSTFTSELTINNVFPGEFIANTSLIDISDLILFNELSDNSLYFDLSWNDTIYNNSTRLKINSDISKLPVFIFNIPDESYISFQNKSWDISTGGNIMIGNSTYFVDDLMIRNDSTGIFLDGQYSNSIYDSLNFGFKNLNISPVNLFFEEDMGIAGTLDGVATISYLGQNPYFDANIKLADINVLNKNFGNLFFKTLWEDKTKAIDINAYLIDDKASLNDSVMVFSGFYYPQSKQGDINGILSLNNFDFGIVEPFLGGAITNPKGHITGDISIKNNISTPNMNGTLNFKNAALTVKFTEATYTFSNSIDILPNAIIFDGFKLYDRDGKSFDLSGRITHNNWRNFGLSLHTTFDKFTFLDNELGISQSIYGKAVLSGTASLEGSADDLDISANVNTESGTEININLASGKTATQHSYIHFVSYDEDSIKINYENETKSNVFKINAMADLQSNAELNIILPYALGEMRINGTGNIAYKQGKVGTFSVVGDYFVNSGSVKLNYQDFLSKEFSIKEGGGIIFNGDPMNAVINIEAIYQLRASLAGISNIDESGGEKRVPVDCIISFTGVLSDPTINFDIELPNVDEDTKSQIFAAIDMDDQSVVAEQVFYLLLMQSFYTTNTANTAVAGLEANSFRIISNQISSWLSNISKNIDFGMNYRPGDELNPNEIEFMFKADLFDNRVIIDGNIGVQNNTPGSTTQASNIVGDFMVEYKITKDGRLRAKAFNRSNEYNLIEQNGPYTQGVGLSYFTEFDKFSDLFRKKRKRNK